ncbi:54S ribosomal protein L8, mitochondrial [Exophiala dermatitidis]|uniref:Large ribosomal subunit protein bL17m n=2 Tax=Exophiala dermatitidis TaxID=5970 RepID=H6BYT8_EXODN|nr:50S ribosomal protein L17 [Exophiala dermatitidis NIH/UT8656]KAJ4520153.1 54S ribosomal protein L8, mitochondrial [Exophiala dermatitidis]EHY56801.1 50S ribosomal protein L17 [Exophiala dermatitidis NIH/UT8656]KAJ4524000.1 54S ribosomal protein L8, mitochondrial [Exophiala dermatitidis]KAJ4525730.1 54S ribosomal protein L8, mitochondrial [Exophiala dermatitidis]KAJ4537057.1 54S ribosomal protein L8, mitochondrial [Exophiala dermatitidis]
MSSIKYRHLSRPSAHRQALLRNLVTSLIANESISTTYAKAKEAQRLAEKLITLGKKNTNAARQRAKSIFFEPERHMDKLFTVLRKRYEHRPGGYTRVLRQEPIRDDQGESAILSLVDGPRDMRFSMTAKALVRQRKEGLPMHELTAVNVRKVTRFRENGEDALEEEVKRLEADMEAQSLLEKSEFEEDGTVYEWVRGEKDRRSTAKGKEKNGPGRLRRQRVGEDKEL